MLARMDVLPEFLVGFLRVQILASDAVEEQVHHGGREQRQHLRHDQAADDRDAQRPAQFATRPAAQRQRHAAKQRRHGRHHDGPEAQQAGLVDRLLRLHAMIALSLEREVDHHDGVLLHNADQQDDADQRDHTQIHVKQQQRKDRADARRRQRRKNRDRVNVALVQHPEHDVHHDQRRQNEQRLVGQRCLKRRGRTLELRIHAGRQLQVRVHLVHHRDRVADRLAGRQIERDGRRRKLALVVDRERGAASAKCVKVESGTCVPFELFT